MKSPHKPGVSIVALSPLFHCSVPPARLVDADFRFHLLGATGDILRWAEAEAPPSGLTVVMQAESFSARDLTSLPRPMWLWFSAPLVLAPSSDIPSGSLSEQLVHERLATTGKLVDALRPDDVDAVIVADESSRAVLADKGFRVLVSSLPMDDDHIYTDYVDPHSYSVGTFSAETPHQKVYRDALEVQPKQLSLALTGKDYWKSARLEVSAGLVIHPDANRCFPMEALVHLASGHTLISEPLWPLFGLEPGLDYFEVTSPSEAFHVMEYLGRSPEVTRLMAYRGKQKSQHFRASATWARLLGELPH